VRDDFLAKLSEADRTAFEKLLNDVTAKLTTEALTQLGVDINVDQKDIDDAAKDFLVANGLVSA
jgi:glycine betaine/choline ABC-type transport system substrate-binding protein